MSGKTKKCISMLLLLIMVCGVVVAGTPLPVAASGQDLDGGYSPNMFLGDLGIEETVSAAMVQAYDAIVAPLAGGYGPNGRFLAEFEQPASGSIPISNRDELEAIRSNLNAMYHLVADIDLDGAEWVPIGESSTQSFRGIFDGQGHVIRNMKKNGYVTNDYYGLFGYASGAIIKNTGLEDTDVNVTTTSSSTSFYVGGIVGYSTFSGSGFSMIGTIIDNCYNTGNISSFNSSISYTGGIAGVGQEISNCYNIGDVSATPVTTSSAYAGGIAVSGSFSDCYNAGCVSAVTSGNNATSRAGGIAPGSSSSTGPNSNCYNIGDVSASGGGYAYAFGIGGGSSSDCYNMGDISASSAGHAYAGGISAGGSYDKYSNCYNTGNIYAATSSYAANAYAGGISCSAGSTSDCYNTGNVTSLCSYIHTSGIPPFHPNDDLSASAGGINALDGTISNCYNTGEVSASRTSSGASSGYPTYAGGISGRAAVINNCYNTGDISATISGTSSLASAGGISGRGGAIGNCYNEGEVSASVNTTTSSDSSNTYAGGVYGLGTIAGYGITGAVSNCYNTGGVSASTNADAASAYAGGVFGSGVSISNCYNIGEVAATASNIYIGGVCGISSGTVTSSYALNNYGNRVGEQLTSAQMKNEANYIDWDFSNVWGITDGMNDGYPILTSFFAVTDAEAVTAGKASLTWDVIKGANTAENNVTSNLGALPTTGANGTTITWQSGDPAVLSDTGAVTRPAYGSGNATVTLTATVSKGSSSDTAVFNLTVIETGNNTISPGDVNGDGIINMQDVLLVYQYFRGKITEFPS